MKNDNAKLKMNGVQDKGFTLVETLIAISVLLMAVVGPLTIASRSLTSASFARDQVTAFYLAQEATEIIRNKRDNNALAGVEWTSGISGCIGGQLCIVDATKDVETDTQNAIKQCGSSCPPIQYYSDTSNSLYGYSSNPGWDDSKFTREISMLQLNPSEIQLTVTISWNNGPINKTFSIQENLHDWQ